MREIKFRAWDKIHKYMEFFELGHLYWRGEDTGDYGFPDETDVVMQYTGLKDKNGKEIYEGDVVKYEKESMIDDKITECFGVVEMLEYPDGEAFYDQKHLGWCATGKEGTKTLPDVAEYSEVIGNIYENPNLI